MVLSKEDASEFYAVWLGLLSYVNDKHGISATFAHPESPVGIVPGDIVPIRDRLWEDTAVIDEYIESRWDMPRQEIAILKGWKTRSRELFSFCGI